MLTIVAFSYRQVCRGYPSAGAPTSVARENSGPFVADRRAALMVDYVMTVAVSSASALANLATAFSAIQPYKVELGALVIILVTAAKPRRHRESGNIFAIPTYSVLGMALLAIVRRPGEHGDRAPPTTSRRRPSRKTARRSSLHHAPAPQGFRRRVRALTGRAIANGVPAFKRPSEERRQTRLIIMCVLLGTIFIGLTFVGLQYGVQAHRSGPDRPRPGGQCRLRRGFLFLLLTISAALILFLACNTSFNAFRAWRQSWPRTTACRASFAFRGDRLRSRGGSSSLRPGNPMLYAFTHRSTR